VESGNPGISFITSAWIVLVAALFGDNTGESAALLIPESYVDACPDRFICPGFIRLFTGNCPDVREFFWPGIRPQDIPYAENSRNNVTGSGILTPISWTLDTTPKRLIN
jgi:hypothetical protein